jgi:hypothetical protein
MASPVSRNQLRALPTHELVLLWERWYRLHRHARFVADEVMHPVNAAEEAWCRMMLDAVTKELERRPDSPRRDWWAR